MGNTPINYKLARSGTVSIHLLHEWFGHCNVSSPEGQCFYCLSHENYNTGDAVEPEIDFMFNFLPINIANPVQQLKASITQPSA